MDRRTPAAPGFAELATTRTTPNHHDQRAGRRHHLLPLSEDGQGRIDEPVACLGKELCGLLRALRQAAVAEYGLQPRADQDRLEQEARNACDHSKRQRVAPCGSALATAKAVRGVTS